MYAFFRPPRSAGSRTAPRKPQRARSDHVRPRYESDVVSLRVCTLLHCVERSLFQNVGRIWPVPRSAQPLAWAQSASQDTAVVLDRLDRSALARRNARRAARTALQVLVFVGLGLLFFLRVPQVEGRSMLPSIAVGNHVLINTLAYGATIGPWTLLSGPIQRGDLIAFARGQGDDVRTYLKRVVALPGDTVAIHDGKVIDSGDDRLELVFRVLAKVGNVDVHVGLVTDRPEPVYRSGVRREVRRPGGD